MLKTVQDRDIGLLTLQWETNRKSYMACQMAAVTLNDPQGCRPFQMQSVEHLCSILHDLN